MFVLVRHVHYLQVVAESETVFGPGVSLTGPLPAAERLRGLQFTEACLREALRKYRCVLLLSNTITIIYSWILPR